MQRLLCAPEASRMNARKVFLVLVVGFSARRSAVLRRIYRNGTVCRNLLLVLVVDKFLIVDQSGHI